MIKFDQNNFLSFFRHEIAKKCLFKLEYKKVAYLYHKLRAWTGRGQKEATVQNPMFENYSKSPSLVKEKEKSVCCGPKLT